MAETRTPIISFKNFSFQYRAQKQPTLHDINLDIYPGERVLIAGPSGSSKSPLAACINGLNPFSNPGECTGSLTVDGVDVRQMPQSTLRGLLGYVPQKGELFSGTIDSNLKFGGEDITDAQVQKAAAIAQATDFIEAKPEGYQSPIAQGGSNVSGGQKQRLAIARAIAKDPHIYVFDDSFSALDMKTDARLRAALAEVTENASVIIVAQRISTIIHADQILVLDDGKIVGKGTHEELLKNCDVYMQIAQSQLSAKELGIDDNKKEGM